jgi:glycosyltransferase involved in cell wall biosynthesis
MAKVLLAANTDWYLYNFRLALAQSLQEQGYEVVLVSPPGKYAACLSESGFRWLPWKVGRQSISPTGELAAVLSLAQIYRQEKPQLVHHFTVKPVLYGSLAARLAHVPCVVNAITGLGYVFLQNEWKARWLRRLVKLLYRLALDRPHHVVIFENDNDRQFFVSQGLVQFSRTRLVEGVGVNTDHFIPIPEQAPPPVIVLPARLLWDKGVGILVEAARLLKKKVDARVVLVGEPDPGNPANISSETIEKWVNEGIIEWWGWQNDMREVYASSHIVTLPSFGEGVPTALLEAAACARPIVTTNVSGCREVVHDGYNGFLVPARQAEPLADALERLVLDPDLRGRMGAAGRQLILKKYTSVRITRETEAVYHSLLAQAEITEHKTKPA